MIARRWKRKVDSIRSLALMLILRPKWRNETTADELRVSTPDELRVTTFSNGRYRSLADLQISHIFLRRPVRQLLWESIARDIRHSQRTNDGNVPREPIPSRRGKTVRPSGFLLWEIKRPFGSFVTCMYAATKGRAMISLIAWYFVIFSMLACTLNYEFHRQRPWAWVRDTESLLYSEYDELVNCLMLIHYMEFCLYLCCLNCQYCVVHRIGLRWCNRNQFSNLHAMFGVGSEISRSIRTAPDVDIVKI